jgi:hypothetical protein
MTLHLPRSGASALSFALALVLPLTALVARPGICAQTPRGDSLLLLPVEGDASIPTLTRELEEAIARALGTGRPQLSSLPLGDLFMALDCAEASDDCLGRVCKNAKRAGIVLATARALADGVELSLRWFDGGAQADSGRTLVRLGRDVRVRAAPLLDAVRELFGVVRPAAVPKSEAGRLVITSPQSEVEVSLDDQPRGTLPVDLSDLRAGRYRVVATRDGYATTMREVDVRVGQTARLEISLVEIGGGSARSYIDSVRLPTWIVAGVGVASLIAAVAVGAHMQSEQHSFDEVRGQSYADLVRMQSLRDSGDREAVAANVLYGLGGGALAVALVLSYLDHKVWGRASRRPAKAAPAALLLGPGGAAVRGNF